MKKSTTSKYLDQIKDRNLEIASEQFSSINIKPSESSSALLEILSKITKKTPSSIIRDNLSYCIAQSILKNSKNPETLKNSAVRFFRKNPLPSNNSAISLLVQAKIIRLRIKGAPSIDIKNN